MGAGGLEQHWSAGWHPEPTAWRWGLWLLRRCGPSPSLETHTSPPGCSRTGDSKNSKIKKKQYQYPTSPCYTHHLPYCILSTPNWAEDATSLKQWNSTRYRLRRTASLLHDAWDIEWKWSFLECKYTAKLHGSTTDCTAVASAHGYIHLLTVTDSCIVPLYIFTSPTYFVVFADSTKYVRLVNTTSHTKQLPV